MPAQTQTAATTITQENFQTQVLSSQKPVLVDFWAQWCPPCKVLGPIMDEVSADTAGQAVVGKLDVDAAREIAKRYNVASIPTVILFSGGKEIERFVGIQPKQVYIKAIENETDRAA
jgi:thioredoxin